MNWELYDALIKGIPEEVLVRDYCLGLNWSYVEAESAMGVSYTCTGGAKKPKSNTNYRGRSLRELAELSKSWCFENATLGVAALNAWYGQRELLDAMGATYDEPITLPDGTVHKMDAFEQLRPKVEAQPNAKVVVVGHFPHVDRVAEYAQLVVLERNCRDEIDMPDPACEFELPTADFAFITGVTIENKTVGRLLQLSENACVVMLGPSVVMGAPLFAAGADYLGGSIVLDPDRVRDSVKSGGTMSFGEALQMTLVSK